MGLGGGDLGVEMLLHQVIRILQLPFNQNVWRCLWQVYPNEQEKVDRLLQIMNADVVTPLVGLSSVLKSEKSVQPDLPSVHNLLLYRPADQLSRNREGDLPAVLPGSRTAAPIQTRAVRHAQPATAR